MNENNIPIYDTLESVIPPFLNPYFIGHNEQCVLLQKLFIKQNYHHAIILSGDKGIGKQTLAFRLAYNIINNTENICATPDYNSVLARQMAQNIHPNFLYISRNYDITLKKFKQNIAINDIAKIKKFLYYNNINYNVVLINSIDDLNTSSSNAILKILEEPPKNTLFLLLSHKIKPIIPTIKSRCINLSFFPLKKVEVLQALEKCLNIVDYNIEKAESILNCANGSVNKAAKFYLTNAALLENNIFKILNEKNLNIININNLIKNFDYELIKEELLNYIANKAKIAAKTNTLTYANKLSSLWLDIIKKIIIIENYNLDKSQELFNIFLELYNIKINYETK